MSTSLKILLSLGVSCMIVPAGGCYSSSALGGDAPDISWRDDGSPGEEIPAEPDGAEMLPDIPIEHPADLFDPPEDPLIEDIVEELPGEDLPPEGPPPAEIIWSEDFEEPDPAWRSQFGTWTLGDGRLAQSSTAAFAETWYTGRTWNNAAIEVSAMGTGIDEASPRAVVGIIFRVQQIDRNFYYVCGLDFNNGELILVRYDQDVPPGYENLCTAESLSPAPSTGIWYKLQVVMDGSLLACRWVQEGSALAEISAHDDLFGPGGIGLFTNKASAEFDNLIVWNRRPDDWPAAESVVACP